ncbi:MAG: hypothetical protein US86_C0012G0003 [Candidatus Daviesbacteria bacterium GW2011_GWA2_38_24]|uniref:Uncharacterized protein n=1 Tax=Candidatus Daviesbacteria bacterium GW2011_GWA2_38_24 TaxID=1618422 RepID=A0A0G0JCB5_9BACT|nr:MAG: hypothetical protein US86_C0012G0003 [Candidatus Daviesbacteria bacterium GW2011_GWA2_38_24]KKQ79143.1 MAG: hypothetical protein UT01_C0050G0009 [Candidatus Daviesbacteria bacterium GW2011_GWA1_38_7]
MSKKILILTIIVLVILLSGLYFMSNTSKQDLTKAQILDSQVQPNPSPESLQNLPIIDFQTDLKLEVEKLTPSDFSNDFKSLKSEI